MEEDQKPVTLGRRAGRSPRDMALSIGILVVPIALFMLFYRVVLGGDSPITVDPQPTLQEARSANVFPVLAPAGLGDDWHVSAATFRRETTGATLRLGYVAPDDNALQIVESTVAPETLLPAEVGTSPEPVGTFRDGKRAWRQYTARPGEHALILTDPGRTVIVVGNSDEKHLKELAASLA